VGLANHINDEFLRARVVLLVMLCAFAFLAMKLWRVQVVDTTRYTSRLDRQSMRGVRLPGIRGAIYDRDGECLAANRPSYCIALYAEEMRQPGRVSNTVNEIERVLDRLSGIIGRPRQVDRGQIRSHIKRRRALPLLAWRDIDNVTLARWAESGERFAGVDVQVQPVREYLHGSLAAHVVGYVGRREPDLEEDFHYYLPQMEGREGIEKTLNSRMSGEAGGRLIRVDAAGFRHTEEAQKPPVPGGDVRLALDLDIQRALERVLAGQRGAGVVLDPENGEVLAMASTPAYNPAAIRSPGTYAGLQRDPHKPLFNRAISGVYPPGSTFKPVVGIAALENNRANVATRFFCPGYFEIGGAVFRCWSRRGHGSIALRKALEQSCNVYFYQLGLQCGYERIYHMADALGFGYRTGVALPGEARGLLPNDRWKREVHGDGWRSGDTCNVSIGQGALLVTPLQMAVYTAALANGGLVWRPRLVLRADGSRAGELVNNMRWSAGTLSVIRQGMYDVVQAERGTGKRAALPGVEMAGKTGSAEYGPRSARKKHAWMILYAPFSRPRYAVSIVIEDALSGGITAAPRMRALMASIFGVAVPGAGGTETGAAL